MRELKLTVCIEPGMKGELINAFGSDYKIVGDRMKFIQFSFPSVRILSAFKLKPIVQLLETFEKAHGELYFKMFHLKDDNDGSYSTMYLQSLKGVWTVVTSIGAVEQRSSNSLFNLI